MLGDIGLSSFLILKQDEIQKIKRRSHSYQFLYLAEVKMKIQKIVGLVSFSLLVVGCVGSTIISNQKQASACDPQNPFECYQQQQLLQPTPTQQPIPTQQPNQLRQPMPTQQPIPTQQPTQVSRQYLQPLQGTRQGEKEIRTQGGFAGAKVVFYRNGQYMIEGRARSNSVKEGVKASTLIVGVDQLGRALFVSPKFDIPTACSKWDACSSDRTDQFPGNVNPQIAQYVDRIDVYVSTRGKIGSFRDSVRRTISQACGSYNELPPAAKVAIAAQGGFAGCGR